MASLLCFRKKVPTSENYSAVDSCRMCVVSRRQHAVIRKALLQSYSVEKRTPSLASMQMAVTMLGVLNTIRA